MGFARTESYDEGFIASDRDDVMVESGLLQALLIAVPAGAALWTLGIWAAMRVMEVLSR